MQTFRRGCPLSQQCFSGNKVSGKLVQMRSRRQIIVAATKRGSIQQVEAQQGSIGRRTALLASLGVWLAAANPLSSPLLAVVQAAAAAAAPGPRQLDTEAKAAVDKALSKVVTKPKAPVILRLAYHDAATFSAAAGDGGANASIRFELDRPENTGLKRGWKLIEQVSDSLKGTAAEGKVSYADLIALAGAHAVAICGGPSIAVPVGRRDAAGPDAPDRMVSEKAGAAALIENFGEKGLGVQQLVVLSGAHTLGGKGFGDPVTFDNAYYTALIAKPWLNPNDNMAAMIGLPSDHALPEDAQCLQFIEVYAADQQLFFQDFVEAYQHLTSLGALWA